jgi:hypothetical protein
MLTRFFINNQGNIAQGRNHGKKAKWRFRGHAEPQFWRWVRSWARAVRRPSDLGFNDDAFVLPELREVTHIVETESIPDGCLFAVAATNWEEQLAEIHRTVRERCEFVAGLVATTGQPAFVGCHLDEEGDLLQALIPDAIQISGRDSDDARERKLIDFVEQRERVVVTKDKIGGWGLNLQHCSHITRFPSHSYEAYYQWVRRCWRFGQTRPVTVDIVTTEGCRPIIDNMLGKSLAAGKMFADIASQMADTAAIERSLQFMEAEVIPQGLVPHN